MFVFEVEGGRTILGHSSPKVKDKIFECLTAMHGSQITTGIIIYKLLYDLMMTLFAIRG